MNIQSASDLCAKGQDGQTTDSVFDFLYYDARRIGSFLSQFDDMGHIKGVTRSENNQKSTTSSTTAEAEGGVPLIAKAKANYVGANVTSTGETDTWNYDPFWTNALSFLDFLQKRGNYCNDLSVARMGQLALIPGRLFIRDLRLMQKVFGLPSVAQQLQPKSRQANRHERRKPGAQPVEEDQSTLFGLELMKLLPHAIQAEVHSAQGAIWCSLNEADMVVDSSDLFLKHGVNVPGEWNILGIVDALPTRGDGTDSAVEAYADAENELDGDFGSLTSIATKGLGGLIDGVVPMARLLLGRRDHQYGVTPLLIFRQAIG